MRKFLALSFAVIFAATLAGNAFAADTTGWTISGDWKYTIAIPTFKVPAESGTQSVSLKETGSADVVTTSADGVETLGSYTVLYIDTRTVNGKTDSMDQTSGSGSLSGAYKPGTTYTHTFTRVLDKDDGGTPTINGIFTMKYTQTEKNKVTGTVKLVISEDNSISADGTMTATRNGGDSGSSGGGCNTGLGAFALLAALPMFLRKRQ